jgi:hypothetical protein
LPRSAQQQIGSAHYVGHVLRSIVDAYSELVSKNSILALDYDIAKLRRAKPLGPLYCIVKKNHGIRGNPKTYRGGSPRTRWSGATRAWISAFIVPRQLPPRATAFERQARGPELLQGGDVYVVALALIYDITFPVQTEALQRAQNAIGAAGHDTRSVQIFDSNEPAATVAARIEITPNRGQQ